MTQQRCKAPLFGPSWPEEARVWGWPQQARFFVFWPQGKILKIRKCIDTCIACGFVKPRNDMEKRGFYSPVSLASLALFLLFAVTAMILSPCYSLA